MSNIDEIVRAQTERSRQSYARALSRNPVILGSPRILVHLGDGHFVNARREIIFIDQACHSYPFQMAGQRHLVTDIQGYVWYQQRHV